jgi:hypothetical protein
MLYTTHRTGKHLPPSRWWGMGPTSPVRPLSLCLHRIVDSLCKHSKILQSIVVSLAIEVMYNLFRAKRAADMLFYEYPMLHLVVIAHSNQDVAHQCLVTSAVPSGCVLTRSGRQGDLRALSGAVDRGMST